MEFRVLRYFLTVAREENITKAAEVLHITQPTLSRQLAQLEEDSGVVLFRRGSRRIELTAEGILLRRRAEEIIELVDKTERELLEQDAEVAGLVTIGAGELTAVQLLGDIIKSCREKYPLMRFQVFTASADLTKERMDRGLDDIGLLLEPVSIEKYEFVRLPVKERWVALMPASDPLAERESVTADDLLSGPLLLPVRGAVRPALFNWLGSSFREDQIISAHNLSTNAAVMVEKGLGRFIGIEGSVPHLDTSKLVYRPLYPEIISTSVLAWKRQQPFSPAVEKFIEHTKCFLSMGEE